ncbi:MAG: helix-turn-helix domain-containing protein [Treponema sp.]|nr:helix-turn-helix domain-containing protein [Treponema sp.]
MRETLDFLGMEQKELAAKTGLSLKTIENYVKKESSIPIADKAVLIAQALGVTVEYLVTGKENIKNETSEILNRNKDFLYIMSKLNDYNHKVILSIAKVLINFQDSKKPN